MVPSWLQVIAARDYEESSGKEPRLGVARRIVRTIYYRCTRFLGRLWGRYYVEDYGRVYPDGIAFTRLGHRRRTRPDDLRNFVNHQRFYRFVAQFVPGRDVVDVGCGSGHGAEILARAGARSIHACDVSQRAVKFARRRFGQFAQFSTQGITDLRDYADAAFDVTISSEVLEHIKEYGREREALAELRRVTRPDGIVVIGTPNAELLGDHGFSFDEIRTLVRSCFTDFVIFENALVPYGAARTSWVARSEAGNTGVIISEAIDLDETVVPPNVAPELKRGLSPGWYEAGSLRIDTTTLHNTHSWVVVARKSS
jgi:2-polyprenyl-3-methyl-5-hydroxy-6-metoxy-1,4-benzoquinol methylase